MENKFYFVLVLLSVCCALAAMSYKETIKINAMQGNITTAIEKGIDPVAVRCAYSAADDNICVAYAITHKDPEPVKAKKQYFSPTL